MEDKNKFKNVQEDSQQNPGMILKKKKISRKNIIAERKQNNWYKIKTNKEICAQCLII